MSSRKVTQYFNIKYLGKYNPLLDNSGSNENKNKINSTLLAYKNFEPNAAPVPNIKTTELKFKFDNELQALYFEPVKDRSFIPSNIINSESGILEIFTKCLKFCSEQLMMDNFSKNFIVTVQILPNGQERFMVVLSNTEDRSKADTYLKNLSIFTLRLLHNISFKVYMTSNSYMLANLPVIETGGIEINPIVPTINNTNNISPPQSPPITPPNQVVSPNDTLTPRNEIPFVVSSNDSVSGSDLSDNDEYEDNHSTNMTIVNGLKNTTITEG